MYAQANRVLNLLAQETGNEYDAGGALAASGQLQYELLKKLDALDYYQQPAPKSLANSFGTDVVYPLVKSFGLEPADALRTYVAHIVEQIKQSIINSQWSINNNDKLQTGNYKLLATGGGAFNTFLISELQRALAPYAIDVIVPDEGLVNYKEALIMALLGVYALAAGVYRFAFGYRCRAGQHRRCAFDRARGVDSNQ